VEGLEQQTFHHIFVPDVILNIESAFGGLCS
jgi:hypothetical protein